jgi:hypothetical protein
LGFGFGVAAAIPYKLKKLNSLLSANRHTVAPKENGTLNPETVKQGFRARSYLK